MDILKPDFGIKEDTFNMTEDDAPIKQSVYIAKDYNPDEFAKAYNVAEKFQTSPMFVADNMQDFEKKSEENDLVDKLKKAQYIAPQIVDIMSSPDNLSLAKDDLDSLIEFERKKRNYSFASDAYNAVAGAAAGAAKNLLQIPTTLPSMIATLGEDNQNTLLGSPLVQAGVEVIRQFGQNNSAANYLNEKQKEFSAKSPAMNSDAFDLIKNGRFGEGGRVLGVQVLGQIPQLTALLGTTFVAGPAAGLSYAGISTATESFNQDIAEGVDKQTALAASAGKGVIEAAFEGIGSIGFVEKTINRVAKTSGKIAANEVAKSMIETVAKGSLINGTEEFATSIAQDYVSYITGENPNALVGADGRAFNSFMIGFGSGGALEGPAAIMAGVATREKQVQVKNDQDFYDQAGAIAKDSKVMQRMPEKYRQIIDEQTKDGPLENVYISREGFKEYAQRVGKPEAELAAEMKIQDELNRADETGADIEVKTSKMSVDVVKTEHYAALRGDVKFKADGLTENELNKNTEQTRTDLLEQIKKANEALTPDESNRFDKEAKQVAQTIVNKLTVDAEKSGREAKPNADIYESFFRNMAPLFGKSPLELFNEYQLNIQKINQDLANQKYGIVDKTYYQEFKSLNNDKLIENSNKLKDEGFNFYESETPVFDENGNETSIDVGQPGYQFTVYAEDNTGNEIGSARFIIDENGDLVADDFDGATEAVTVDASFRRKGIATELYRMASEHVGKPVSDKNQKTPQGKSFRDSLRALNPKMFFQDKRASIVQLGNKKYDINLFAAQNESSFIHESAHFFLEVLGDAATSEGATEEGKAFYAEALKLLNVESREQIGEKEQEMFARSFEAYLLEGKAPSKRLQKAFAAFKTWLVNIYKNIAGIENEAGFKVNVSPEMKSFFDRMLASEQEIAAYRKDAPQPIASQNAILEVLNEQEALEYLNAVELSRLDAEDKLRARLMSDLIRKADSKYKAKFNELLDQGYKTASEFQEFKTMKAIKENPELRISSDIADKIDKKYRQYLPKDLFVKDGGMDVQAVAEMFGYANSGSLLEALMPYRKGIDAWAETYAATEIKKTYPELLESPELSNEAIKAAHNENYRLVKKFELEFLAKNYPRVVKTAAYKLIRRMPKTKAVIQQASNLIAATNVREVKPHIYLNAERKFAALAAKEFKKGNLEAAFDAKYKEYLNFELYREAVKAKEDVEKRVQKFKDNFKRKDEDLAKSRDTDLINAGREILKQFGILSGPRSEVDHLEKIKAYEPDVYQHLKGLVDVVAANAGNYSNISYNKFTEMADVVDSIWDLSKSRREIVIDGKKMDTKEIATDLAARMRTLTPQELAQIKKVSDDSGKFKTSLLSLKASLTRVEAWASGMGGNFHKYIYQPIADATTQYRLDKEMYLNKYKNIVEQFLKPQDQVQMFETPIISTELNAEFKGKSQLLGALLHTGNESNLSKLLEGRGWADKNADGTLSTNRWDMFVNRMIDEGVLTKDDFDFVQSVWDLFEEMKPSVQKAHKQILGYYMNEITAKPFSNKFGEYHGGYAPAKTDPNSVQGADLALKQMAENLGSDASFVFPTTGRGATKTRNEAYKAPLSVDLNMVGSHIEWAVKFSNVEPAVKQVLSVIKTPEFSNALFDFDKTLMQSMIMPWLDRTAKQTRIEQSKSSFGKLLDKGTGFLRRNSATAIMTLNVVNSMEQFGGLSVAMTMVKPAKIKLAFIDYINNPSKMVDFVIGKSSFMKSTQGSNIYELNDQINDFLLNPSKFDEMKAYFRKHTYILQTFTQNIVNTVSWVGAYNQAIEDGKTETEAIKFADSVIRQTQGTNLPEDVSEYETGTQTSLLFKQFTGYFNMLANLSDARIKEIAREVGLRKGAGRLFYLYMTLMAVPAAISTALRMGAAGAAADEDDDESFADDFLASFFGTQARTVFATVPYAGQVLNAAYGKIATKQQYDDRLSLSPAISILESAAQGPGGVIKDIVEKGEVSKRSLKDSLMFIGLMTSTPTNVLGKPLGYLMDVQSGRAEPTGPIDFTRGLVTGKPGSQ